MTTTASSLSALPTSISSSSREGSRSANPFTASAAPSSLRAKAMTAAAILAVFTVYSMWVVFGYGYTGFLSLAMREPWAMQLLLDLVIACMFGIGWMVHDARTRSIASWPFVIVTLAAGSVGLLGYVVWRGFAARSTPRPGT
jgi:hypothetical protein